MQDITATGTIVNIIGSTTFPLGFPITQFADDADPLDFASIQIADTAMGLNGDLISWSRAIAIPMTLNVLPGGVDDLNLQILAEANRVGRGRVSALDIITATIIYPDASLITLTNGKLIEYNPGKGIASSARLKTRTYTFSFEQKIGA
jgi:hypothetical protein